MNSHKRQLAIAWRRITDAIGRLSEDDISKLVGETYSIEIRLTRKHNKEDAITPTQEVDLANIVEKLTGFPNREDAHQFLDANFSTRKSVESIARKLDIPISKQDKVETLRDKVIEATVGARVRSQAIQGGKV